MTGFCCFIFIHLALSIIYHKVISRTQVSNSVELIKNKTLIQQLKEAHKFLKNENFIVFFVPNKLLINCVRVSIKIEFNKKYFINTLSKTYFERVLFFY